MTEAIISIKQWGNHLGIRLPAAIAREVHLQLNQHVRISVNGNHVVIPCDSQKLPKIGTQIDQNEQEKLSSFQHLLCLSSTCYPSHTSRPN